MKIRKIIKKEEEKKWRKKKKENLFGLKIFDHLFILIEYQPLLIITVSNLSVNLSLLVIAGLDSEKAFTKSSFALIHSFGFHFIQSK